MSRVIDATLKLIDDFTRPLNKAVENMKYKTRAIQKTGREIQAAGKSITSFGSNLTRKVTIPLLGLGTASAKMSMDFDKSLGKIKTLLDDQKNIKGYEKTIINLSNKTALPLKTMSDGMYQTISSIGDHGKQTQKIFKTMATSAKAGGAEVKDAVSLISAGMKGYGQINDKTAKKISDLAFQTAKLGVTTFPEMAESMQPLFPLGNSLNVSYEELFGSMATLTGVTGNTAEVTTQMKSVFNGLIKPTKAMSSLMNKYGFENGESMIKAKGLGGVLKILQKETGGQSDKLGKLFSNSRALTAMTALTGSQMEVFNEKLGKMQKSSGSTEVALSRIKTVGGKINYSMNILKNTMTQFGKSVMGIAAPYIVKFSEKLEDLNKWFNGLSDGTKKTIVKFGMMAAAAGPMIMVFGKITSGIGKTVIRFGKLLTTFSKFGSALGIITAPAAVVIGALLGLVAAGVLVYKNWDRISKFSKKLSKFISDAFKASGIDVKKLGKAFVQIGNLATGAVKKIIRHAAGILTSLKPILKFISGTMLAGIKIALSAAIGYFAGLLSGVTSAVKGIMEVMNGIIDFVKGVFTGNWKQAWTGVKEIFKGIFDTFAGLCKTPINAVIGLINGAISGINKLHVKIPKGIPGVGGKEIGFHVPKIPMLYKGTNYFSGGLTHINEKGGEIVDLPRGTRVYPHDRSVKMAKKEGKGKGIVIQKLADQIIIRKEEDIDWIMDTLARRLERANANIV